MIGRNLIACARIEGHQHASLGVAGDRVGFAVRTDLHQSVEGPIATADLHRHHVAECRRAITKQSEDIAQQLRTSSAAVWLGAFDAGPFRLRLDAAGQLLGIDDYSQAPGRQAMGDVHVFPGREGPWFIGGEQIRRFDGQDLVPVADLPLPDDLAGQSLWRLRETADGTLWLRSEERTWVLRTQAIGPGQWQAISLRPLDDRIRTYWIEADSEQAWFARVDGVVRLELGRNENAAALPATLISALQDPMQGQPLPWPGADDGAADWARAALPRALRLQFALPSFAAGPASHQYRSRLLGLEADWSPWSASAERSYTNLPDGHFRFQVQARDALGRLADPAELPIEITPPWWRHPLARLLQFGLLLAGMLLSYRWLVARRERRLLATQAQLERNVAERTAELASSNAQLQAQAQRLRQVDELKSRFFDNVSHEFRTPLSLVLGPLDDVLHDARVRLGERTREHLEMANRNARRVLDLIIELLDVNRLEQGQLPLRCQPLELTAFLRRQMEALQPLIDRHGHQLGLQLCVEPAWVHADPLQLERCLGNLVGNAAKYTARGGRIDIALEPVPEGLRISVSDSGRGITAEALPHVFDRFYRAAYEGDSEGTGIGLALVREIIQAHGGEVGVHSEPGRGSCFWLLLPAVEAPPAAGSSSDGNPLESALQQPPGLDQQPPELGEASQAASEHAPLVLLIDDHPDLLQRLRDLIGDRYRVLTAADGDEGLRLARRELPDVVVSDVMMPGLDGISLARRLRADPATEGLPLLLLTARAGARNAVEGLGAGADDYLAKPFDGAELLARIAALLAQRRRLYHQLRREAAPPPTDPSSNERWRERLQGLIEANLGDSRYGIDQLAEAMHSDRSTLFRKVKASFGMSPSELLREARLQRAQALLLQQAGNVTEVAYAVGFESLSSFARAFRQRFEQAPSDVLAGARAQDTTRSGR